jgi:hypothetical protein
VCTTFRWGNLKKRDLLEDPGKDGGIILSWITRTCYVGLWNGSSWLRVGTGTCECSDEPSDSIKCGESLD